MARNLTTKEAAEYLGLAKATLEGWRSQDAGPPYFRLQGGSIRYSQADLDLWLAQHRVEPKAKAKGAKHG